MVQAKQTLITAFLGMRAKLARSVASIVPQRDLEDVVQDTFLRIQEVKSTEHIRNPESFIYKTARNLALDHIKRAETRLADSHDDVESAEPVAELSDDDATYRHASSVQEFGEFCSAVHQLPAHCRRVFVLRKVYGFSQKEIAEALGISQSTVEKHVARGLKLVYLHLRARHRAGAETGAVADIAEQRARRGRR